MQPEPSGEVAAEREHHLPLATAAAGGALWQGASFILGKLLVLATTMVLARLLTPDEFGMVALALVFITYAEVVTDLGVAQALIYLPSDRRTIDSALVIAVGFGLLLFSLAFVLAPFAASFLGRADITTMFRVLATVLVLDSLGQVPDALLRKRLLFRRRILAELARTGTQGVVTIALAIEGWGPWAIVVGYLSGAAAWSFAAWIVVDHKPRFPPRLDRSHVRDLLVFGAPAATNALLLSLVFNIDYLIVGRVLGVEALGFYTLAFRIPQVGIISVFYVLSGVAFPVFARARDDLSRLGRGYLLALRVQAVYGLAAGFGLAAVAPVAVPILFGERWAPSIVPLQALALYAGFRSLGIGAVDLYKAMGRPGLALRLSLVRLVVVAPALWFATRYGINGVSWTQAAVALALAALMQLMAGRLLGLPSSALPAAIGPGLATAVALGVTAAGIVAWLPASEVIRLVTALVAGGLAGLGALRISAPALPGQVRQLFGRRQATAT